MTAEAWREAARAASALGAGFSVPSPALVARLEDRLDLPPGFEELLATGWPTAPADGLPPPLEPLLDWLERRADWPRDLLPVALEPVLAVRLDPSANLVRMGPDGPEPTVQAWRSRLVEWARMAPLLSPTSWSTVDGERVATPVLETQLRERFPSEALGEVLRRSGLRSQAFAREQVTRAAAQAVRARWLLFASGLCAVASAAAPGPLLALATSLAVLCAARTVHQEQRARRWSTVLPPAPRGATRQTRVRSSP